MMKSRALPGKDIIMYHMNSQVHSQGIAYRFLWKILARSVHLGYHTTCLRGSIWGMRSQECKPGFPNQSWQLLGDIGLVCSGPWEPTVADPLLTTRWAVCGPVPPDKRLRDTSRFHQLKFNEEWKEVGTCLKDACLIFFFPSSKWPCIFNGCRLTPVMNLKCLMHIKAWFRKH